MLRLTARSWCKAVVSPHIAYWPLCVWSRYWFIYSCAHCGFGAYSLLTGTGILQPGYSPCTLSALAFGVISKIRTCNLPIISRALCQLSYDSVLSPLFLAHAQSSSDVQLILSISLFIKLTPQRLEPPYFRRLPIFCYLTLYHTWSITFYHITIAVRAFPCNRHTCI